MSEATGWLNMSRGWRRSAERLMARGPTQEEAQERKVKRDRWIARWMEETRGAKEEALRYLPASLAA